MARQRDPARDMAKELWLTSSGSRLLKDIAAELGKSEEQIRKWKNQDQWEAELKGNVTIANSNVTKSNGNVTFEKKRGAPRGNKNAKGHGAPLGNQNALGNRGGPGAPLGNKLAEKHGFFSRIFPEDTFGLAMEIIEKDPLDILWENIVIQYTAIARAQRLMYVRDQEDITEHLKREKESSGFHSDSWEKEYEIQFAWDKHANFLKAQSAAMKSLEGLIVRYEDLIEKYENKGFVVEEHRLRLDGMRANIKNNDEKIRLAHEKLELDRLQVELAERKLNGPEAGETADDGFIEALAGKVSEVWGDGKED